MPRAPAVIHIGQSIGLTGGVNRAGEGVLPPKGGGMSNERTTGRCWLGHARNGLADRFAICPACVYCRPVRVQ